MMHQKFVRYVAIGLSLNAVLYAAYLLLTWRVMGSQGAMTITFTAGVLLSFIGNRKWSFEHRGKAWPSLIRYCIAYLIGYALNFFMLSFFVDRLGYPHQLVQAAAVIAVAGFLFLMLNFFVFPRQEASNRQMT
jgi:putative flippase GtrA